MIVCCVKVGDKYSNEYVYRLQAMCEKYLPPHLFVCVTDDPTLTCLTVEAKKHPHIHTWWHKITLFDDKPFGFGEKFLYLDLDVVVVDDLKPFMGFDSDFAIIKDWNTGGYNSSVMLIEPGSQKQVYDAYMADPVAGKNTLNGDQGFIERHAKADLWPEGWCVSYKGCQSDKTCLDGPTGKIIVFHGKPDPHECDNWVKEYWHV
jgi:hypothetical protein